MVVLKKVKPTTLLVALAMAFATSAVVNPPHARAGLFPSTYDGAIEGAWEIWHPGEDWRWGKAQFFQESRLDPIAVSPVGAMGIGQFMPATWGDVPAAVRLGVVDRRVAAASIRAGAWYMRQQKRFWSAPRSVEDRRRLAQASYNAGAGNIHKSQKRCQGTNGYCGIIACLHLVTGERNAHETRTYVERIARWKGMML